jgi:hypothetical protein
MFASAALDGTVKVWTAPWSGIEGRREHREKSVTETPRGGIIVVESPRPMKVVAPAPSIIT